MWRTYIAVLAIILPVFLGLGLVYLYAAGVIGVATTLAGSFALVAFAVTAVIFHGDMDEPDGDAVTHTHLRV